MLADAAVTPRLSDQLNRTGADASTAASAQTWRRRPGRRSVAAPCGGRASPIAKHGQKMAAPCGTAKFREETSKKADSTTKVVLLRCTT